MQVNQTNKQYDGTKKISSRKLREAVKCISLSHKGYLQNINTKPKENIL
jgi:hypothetical protein